ncbi:hypothetical protein HK100_003003 [Physocladia obscura]|uniref:RGS domain-containing protein n=1 Tax=Physocladia obscura TaxID=109957 RepID=A0AAD5SUZ7_9FUNG|nr:hypothetical protein HK100_003003 [Physocladia obscura]
MPSEIRREIRDRIERMDDLDVTVFDAVQEQVLATLQTFLYPRFLRSNIFKTFDDQRKDDPKLYITGQIHSFAQAYPFDIKTIKKCTEIIQQTPLTATAQNLLQSLNNNIPLSTPASTTSNEWREVILAKVCRRYGAAATANTVGYFDNTVRNNWSLKQKRITKEKKLSKFFGQRVGEDAMKTQNIKVLGEPNKNSAADASTEEEAGSGGGIKISDVLKALDELDNDDDATMRRKKIEKLRNIFGDQIPAATSVDTSNSSINKGHIEMETYDTVNELSADDRRILNRRNKKLVGMLGETVDAKLVGVVGGKNAASRRQSGPPTFTQTKILDNTDPQNVEIKYIQDTESLQTTSATSTDNAEALINTLEDETSLTKEGRKRRLDKLSQVLGQRITDYEVSADASKMAKIQTFRQKTDVRRKVANIESRIGRLLTAQEKASVAMKMKKALSGDILQELEAEEREKNEPTVTDDAGERLFNLVTTMVFTIQNTTNLDEFLDLMSCIADEITERTDKSLEDSDNELESSESVKRKRVLKLKRFFKRASVTLSDYIDTQIIRVLEIQIGILVTDAAEIDVLKEEILKMRGILNSRSPDFQAQLDTNPNRVSQPPSNRNSILSPSDDGKYANDKFAKQLPPFSLAPNKK